MTTPPTPFIEAEDIPIPILHQVSAGRLGALAAVMASLAGHTPMLEGGLQDQVALDLRFRRAEDEEKTRNGI